MDAEEWADHLRLEGHADAVVSEFEQRAATDLNAALYWLRREAPARESEPDAFVDEDFVDTTDLEYGGFWAVLADGVPAWPDGIEPGQRWPVARRILGLDALILYVWRRRPGQFVYASEEYEAEIASFRQDSDGTWVEIGGGGGGWYNPFDPPDAFLEKYKLLATSEVAFRGGLAIGGLCSADVAAVLLDGVRYEVDPLRRVFLVAATALPAEVWLVAADGEMVLDRRGRPVGLRLEGAP